MDTFNICYSADAQYAEQLTVSVASVLKNSNKNEKINFYILDGGLSDEDREKILALKTIKSFSIDFVTVNPNDFVTCPLLKNKNDEYSNYHVTLPTYFRFKLCEYFPDLDKILYLDCDVIIRTSLKEFYNQDISEYSACMIKDVECQKESERLGLSSYFNAGVMLVNLKYWYQNNIPSMLFDCAISRKDDIIWQDQDILNIVLSESVKDADSSWNFQFFLYPSENIEALSECKILHFAGKYKPWLRPFEHVVYDIYYKYLNLTAYANREIIYRRAAFGKFLTPDFLDKKIVVGEIATGFDIQGVNDEISKSYSKIDALGEALEKCYRYTEEKISEYAAQEQNRVNDAVNRIYEEINKNYKYTEAQDSEYNDKISGVLNSKIDEINTSLNKYSAFFEAYILESVGKLEYDTSNKIKNIIEEISDSVNSQTDDKIEKVYSEITNNYEFTKNIVSENKAEIISSSENKISELLKLIKDVSSSVENIVIPDVDTALIERLKNEYEAFSSKLREIPLNLSAETDKKLDNVYTEIRNNAEYLKSRLNDALVASSSEFSQISDKIRDELRNAINEVQSKIASDFIKNDTRVGIQFADLKGEISKTHSVLVSDIERLKSDLTVFFESTVKNSEENSNLKISEILSRIDELSFGVSQKSEEFDKNFGFFKELQEKNYAELQVLIENARLYTDYKFKCVNDVLDETRLQTAELIKSAEEKSFNDNLNIKVLFDEKLRDVESSLACSSRDLSEKIYSMAVDFAKRTDELSKFFESKLSADIENFSFNSEKKSTALKTGLLSKIDEKTEDIYRSQKKMSGEIYEFANNNFKELYDSFNSANSGIKENFEIKTDKLMSYISDLNVKTEELSSLLSVKADKSLKDEIVFLIESVSSKLSESFEERLAEKEKLFDEKLNEQRIKYEQKLIALEEKFSSFNASPVVEKNDDSAKKSKINILNKLKRVK